ncbi:hypothetical protein JIR001_26910 [Polycladomyces abyssicola]|uniref:Uncharacterized protein n=1 Tax=Polycladomyces abyssicola TaxID=1125966 RepID=A0A8D5ZQ21_9BACL|nr:hypothetical protein [Polycladomyces abyssicola]BCU82908.1 hypothetical protein JIR001_26910 [Polycladomyces abyssicola]
MFFSLLYLIALIAIIIFTVLSIVAIIRDQPVTRWLMGLTAVAFIYVFLVAMSVWI